MNKDKLCDKCRIKLESDFFDSYMARCSNCGNPLISSVYKCTNCGEYPFFLYSISDYKSSFSKQILERFKFYGEKGLCNLIADIYYRSFCKMNCKTDEILVVPVPCSCSSKKKRGWDQMEVVAGTLYKKYKIPYKSLLENISGLKVQQKELSRQQRIDLSKGKYRITNNIDINKYKKFEIYIIDDVVTTGSTVRSCYEVLTDAGLNVKGVISWFNEM